MAFLFFIAFTASTFFSHADTDLSGVYNGAGHYGKVTVTPRGGGDFLLTTCGNYQSNCLPIQAVVYESSPNRFSTRSGFINAYYDSLSCQYTLIINVSVEGNSIYLSEFGPGVFPQKYNGCPPASVLSYSQFVEPAAYKK